jgi:hypothetical protein
LLVANEQLKGARMVVAALYESSSSFVVVLVLDL